MCGCQSTGPVGTELFGIARSSFRRSRGWRGLLVLAAACTLLLSPRAAAQITASKTNPSTATGTPAHAASWILDGEQQDDGFGEVVAGVGDVNKDGFADVLVAAPRDDIQRGRVFVFHGSTNGPARAPTWELRGQEAGDQLGHGAAAAGDVNGDGFADVLVATLGNRPGGIERNVTVAIYTGSASGLRTNALWTIRDGEEHYGCTVGSAGDVNRDGFGDVFVSWLKPPPSPTPHRGLLVFHGSPAGPGMAPNWRIAETGPDLKASLGATAAAAGDVNGDGFHDLLVSVPGHRSPAEIVGGVLVCYGSSGGIAGSQPWRTTEPWRVRLVEGVMDAPARYRWLLALAALSGVGLGAYGIGRLYERHRQAVIAGERADMQQQERMRIAQDLHDDLAPRLNQLGWRVSREKELGQDAGNLEQMETATREMSLSLRQIIWSLDPEQDTLETAAKRVWRVWPVAEPGSCSESGRPNPRNNRAGLIAPNLPARSCQLREQQVCSDCRMSEPPST